MPKSKTGALVLRARATAVSRLIDAHDAEFDDYMAEACANLNVAYTRKPTKEDLARQKIEALLAANPALKSEYGQIAFEPSGLDEFAKA